MLGHPRIAVVAYYLPSKASWKLVLENETRQVTSRGLLQKTSRHCRPSNTTGGLRIPLRVEQDRSE